MGVEKFLDLPWVDIFTAADNHILDAPHNVDIALVIHHGQVAGVHPARCVDGFGAGIGVIPIAEHDAIAARTQFAWCTIGDNRTRGGIDNLDLHMGMDLAHGADLLVERRADARLGADGAGLGHAVTDFHITHVHQGLHLLHHLYRTGGAGHDTGAQGTEIIAGKIGVVEFGNKHGRHAIECRGPFLLHGVEDGLGVKAVVGIDHGGAVAHTTQVPHHHAKTVVERHRDDEAILVGEIHDLRHKVTVVEDVVVAEGRAFGVASGAAGVLDVDRVVKLLLGLPFGQLIGADAVAQRQQITPGQHAGRRFGSQPHDGPQIRQLRRRQSGPCRQGLGVLEFRR